MTDTILMLPPLPGTDTAHPAFEIDKESVVWFSLIPRTKHSHRVVHQYHSVFPSEWVLVAAAAIAHYWQMDFNQIAAKLMASAIKRNGGKDFMSVPEYEQAHNQRLLWREIASGSREYDQCKIVAYEPRKEKSCQS